MAAVADSADAGAVSRNAAERRQSEEMFRLAVEASPNAMILVDGNGRILLANSQTERLFGFSQAELIGAAIEVLLPERFRSRHFEHRAGYLAEARARSMWSKEDIYGLRKDGSEVPVEIGLNPTQTGHETLILCSIIDITERKQREAARAQMLAQEREARALAEMDQKRSAFLARASEILATSLEYEVTLDSVAQLAVPQFADWCTVDIADDQNSVRRIAIAHPDAEKIKLAEELQRSYPPDPDNPLGVLNVIMTGQPELYPEVPDSLLVQNAHDARHLELLRALGTKSVMIVPFRVRGRSLGAITFVAGASNRRYSETDLGFARELAYRAALAVDDARHYREAQDALRKREQALELHRIVDERLSVLIEASSTLLGAMRLPEVQLAVLQLAGRLIPADAYAVWRQDPLSKTWSASSVGLSESFKGEVAHSGDYVHQMLEDKLAIENVREPSWLSETQAAYRAEGIESLLIVPLRLHGKLMGTINFYYRNPHRFDELEVRVATTLANLAEAAIRTAELYEEQRVLRAGAEEASRLKDEFLATVSHELRTPLNSILGWARILHSGRLDADSARRAAESIERNARSQNQIIEDLLEVSRIITGKLRLEVSLVDLRSMLEEAIDSVKPAAQAKGIQLQSRLDPRAGPVTGDPERLQQVFWNLLSNAVKFTPEGGLIQVRLQRIGRHVEITVQDNGIGIDRKFLPYVFDRFRQADSTATRTHGGMGIGLAIVRHLVELHGGTVMAESGGAGKGSTFTISLPPASVPHEVTSAGTKPQKGELVHHPDPDLKGMRVLAVDDEADARELLTTIVRQYGAEAVAAASAAEALNMLEDWHPNILVADIGMPDEDGYALILKIRSLPPERGGDIPAVALTAYARAEDRRRALAAGYQMHVAKPVDPKELALKVADLAGKLRHSNGANRFRSETK